MIYGDFCKETLLMSSSRFCCAVGTVRAPFTLIILEIRQKSLWRISPKLDNPKQSGLINSSTGKRRNMVFLWGWLKLLCGSPKMSLRNLSFPHCLSSFFPYFSPTHQDDLKRPVRAEEERCTRPWAVSRHKPTKTDGEAHSFCASLHVA